MAISTLTSKNQATLPAIIRKFLGVSGGDKIDFEICDNAVVVKKVTPIDMEYLKALESTLDEWNSEEDDAYNEL
jgi:antitoxin PrlF